MNLSAQELSALLDRLIHDWESEIVEFKQGGSGYSTSDIGKYFSALANEANLRGAKQAWLVFGINDKTHRVAGTEYRTEPYRLQSLKMEIAQDTEPRVTFREIYELEHSLGRVLLMEIPPAPRGIPISWKGFYYARAGESLTSLGVDKQDAIRQQSKAEDWTATVVEGATEDELDPAALAHARAAFAQRHANRFPSEEIAAWPLSTFLERARLTKGGSITRAALLLLGKPESAHFLTPHLAELTWKLIGQEQAYEHFGLPFLLNTTALYSRIRNIQLRLLPPGELLPREIAKYDELSVLEALHNCIAHQDYSRHARVLVTEYPDRLVFNNQGGFFDGTPDEYVLNDKTPTRYRNPFLVQAMTELNMIDRMGYGIHRMHDVQAKRYLPLPDYELQGRAGQEAVTLTIYGGVVDQAYTRLLMQRTDMPFTDILALDRVQKKLPIPEAAVQRLRRAKLIEGRRPNLCVAADVAAATGGKAEYIRTRAQDDTHYAKLILDYLRKFRSASRRDIDELLIKHLSDVLSEKQKRDKVTNLLSKMRRNEQIRNAGSRQNSRWELF